GATISSRIKAVTTKIASDAVSNSHNIQRRARQPRGSPGDAKHRPETRGVAALLTMGLWQSSPRLEASC
ncbi:MAG: hypothetical protein ACJ8EE_16515, partial [Bradyrhizobium sp.]